MSTIRKTLCAAVTCCVVFLAFGGLSAFADPVVGGDQSSTVPASTDSELALNPDGDPILMTAAIALQSAPQVSPVIQVKRHAKAIKWLGGMLMRYQKATAHWQLEMGKTLKLPKLRHLYAMSVTALKRNVTVWRHRAAAARHTAQNPPHLAAFMCIHHYEGSWTDSGSPYYGGLQMDLGFQQTYAPNLLRTKGTADHWTPLEQIWTAERAARSRGFYPWPNTARYCGLL